MDDISQKDTRLIKCAGNYYGSDVINGNLNEIAEGYGDYKGFGLIIFEVIVLLNNG